MHWSYQDLLDCPEPVLRRVLAHLVEQAGGDPDDPAVVTQDYAYRPDPA